MAHRVDYEVKFACFTALRSFSGLFLPLTCTFMYFFHMYFVLYLYVINSKVATLMYGITGMSFMATCQKVVTVFSWLYF